MCRYMKSLLKILFLTVFGLCLASQAMAAENSPEIKFEQTRIKMGTIQEKDGKVNLEFPFVNVGKTPLVIISATASCGCTQPKFTEDPINPGQSGVVKVSYNPSGKRGEVSSTVTIRTNDPGHKKVILRITGTVIPKK